MPPKSRKSSESSTRLLPSQQPLTLRWWRLCQATKMSRKSKTRWSNRLSPCNSRHRTLWATTSEVLHSPSCKLLSRLRPLQLLNWWFNLNSNWPRHNTCSPNSSHNSSLWWRKMATSQLCSARATPCFRISSTRPTTPTTLWRLRSNSLSIWCRFSSPSALLHHMAQISCKQARLHLSHIMEAWTASTCSVKPLFSPCRLLSTVTCSLKRSSRPFTSSSPAACRWECSQCRWRRHRCSLSHNSWPRSVTNKGDIIRAGLAQLPTLLASERQTITASVRKVERLSSYCWKLKTKIDTIDNSCVWISLKR